MRIFSNQRSQPRTSAEGQSWARVFIPLGLVAFITPTTPASPACTAPRAMEPVIRQVEWVIQAEDSVCGVVEARQIRKPAKVDFDRLVDLTPEGKKIKRDRIDPDSAEGVRLMNRAKSRVRDASAIIMKRQGYDSVWKDISSKKGTYITDLTAYVEIEIQNSPTSSAPRRP